MSTCLTCSQWDRMGLPGYADRMGLCFCLAKRTRAVTMAHWRSCELWVRASSEVVAQRVVWLRDRGVNVKKGVQ